MKHLVEEVERIWCSAMHSHVMWPVHGEYRCAVCLRAYPIPFALPGRRIR